MFTGLIEETGRVLAMESRTGGYRLTILAGCTGQDLRIGDSLAVNGCCLTAVTIEQVPPSPPASRRRGVPLKNTGDSPSIAPEYGGHEAASWRLQFDLLEETCQRTNLSEVVPGSWVNLERSLRFGDRMGGHFVTGHVDLTGEIQRWEPVGRDWVLEVRCPRSHSRLLIEKGSVAVDGISLTVANRTRTGFRVWIIPHTYANTALKARQVGDRVNLEMDMLGKYVDQLIHTKPSSRKSR